jgi:hypothetical protein
MFITKLLKTSLLAVIFLFATAAQAEYTCYYQRTDYAVATTNGFQYPVFESSSIFETTAKAKAWSLCQASAQGGAFSCEFLGCE